MILPYSQVNNGVIAIASVWLSTRQETPAVVAAVTAARMFLVLELMLDLVLYRVNAMTHVSPLCSWFPRRRWSEPRASRKRSVNSLGGRL